MNGTKRCSKCGEEKPLECFGPRKKTKDGKNWHCKKCHAAQSRDWKSKNRDHCRAKRLNTYALNIEHRRAYSRKWSREHPEAQRRIWRKTRHGITIEQYNQMVVGQNGLCAICLQSETATDNWSGRPRTLSIDHDHSSNQIRGLLCTKCNRSLGLMRDDPCVLEALLAYLSKHAKELVPNKIIPMEQTP
jgi:hypothetical protein